MVSTFPFLIYSNKLFSFYSIFICLQKKKMNKRNVVSKYIYNFIFSLIFLLLCVWFLYFIEIYRYVMFVIQSQYKCKNTKNKHKSKMRINCSIWKNLKKKRKKNHFSVTIWTTATISILYKFACMTTDSRVSIFSKV